NSDRSRGRGGQCRSRMVRRMAATADNRPGPFRLGWWVGVSFDKHYEFRDELVSRVERDLIGPSSPKEVIADRPITKYAAGILFPQSDENAEDDNALDLEVE